jgi:uncharacterized protein (DUF1800 family)
VNARDESIEAADLTEPAPARGRLGLLSALAAAAATAAACGGGGGGGGDAPAPPTSPPRAPAPAPGGNGLDPDDMAAARLLLHAQVAATEADIAAVRSLGPAAWLEAQMALPLGQTAWDWLVARGYTAIDENRFHDMEYPIDFVVAQQLVQAPDGVRKRLALALSEFFVIGIRSLMNMPWRYMGVAHFWDQLGAHAFGNFRQLLEAVTLNPAMGLFLNTKGNAREDPLTGRVPDENYAREVMQLFTIGLVQLQLDGTPVTGSDGRPLPTYTQDDVTQLARVFTGYDWWSDGTSFTPADGFPRPYPEFARRPMVLNPALHSTQAVSFLGTTIPAGTPAAEQLRRALDRLFNHPNVGPFFARQMIQRLVTSHPSPAYVARVAARFNDNGSGVRGDLKAVWRAILLDDEATGAASLASPTFGKLREPMIRMLQWARTFDARSARGTFKWMFDYENPALWYDQRPFYAPSVFNFFRPGYVPPGTALAALGATAPEFQIVNESTVAQWVNQIEVTAYNGIYVVWPDRPGLPLMYEGPYPGDGTDINTRYTPELALAADSQLPALVQRLNLLLCAGQLSEQSEAAIRTILADNLRVGPTDPDDWKRARVAMAVTLVMCTPDYLVQK